MSTPDAFTGIVATNALRKFSSNIELETADATTAGSNGVRLRQVVAQATTASRGVIINTAVAWGPEQTHRGFTAVGGVPTGESFASLGDVHAWVAGSYAKAVLVGADFGLDVVLNGIGIANFATTATVPWPAPITSVDLAELLSKVRAASAANNLRQAYREIFRMLNRLFAQGDWGLAAAVLRVLCAQPYPVSIGVGAVRFSSSVARHLSKWRDLIKQLERRIVAEGKDPSEVLRGLEDGRSV